MPLRIGFVGTRFAGLDGVSLETAKWVDVLEEMGHDIYWFAGELDTPSEKSFYCPKAFFKHSDIIEVQQVISSSNKRPRKISDKIYRIKEQIKNNLYKFIQQFDIDLIITENALSIPMNIPLGIAITEVIAETGIPTIGHHHDFAWERNRFLTNAFGDYLTQAFPPDLPSVKHVVINSIAQQELAARRGLSSVIIPNVLDFREEYILDEEKQKNFRKDFNFDDDDIIFLQPTRIVARKGIEHAIDLVRKLNNPKIKLVITHSSSDEGLDYYNWIINYAKKEGINIYFISNKLHSPGSYRQTWERIYTLWDVYPFADFITYPSSFEGFGNAFLEAIYFKKPILVNRYSIYIKDIEPKGFKAITMDQYITDKTLENVKKVLEDESYRQKIVNVNFRLGKRYFSYTVLRRVLKFLITSFFGEENGD